MKNNTPAKRRSLYHNWSEEYGIDAILNRAFPDDFIYGGVYVNLPFKYHSISVMQKDSATAQHCARTSIMGVKTGAKLKESGHYGGILADDYLLDVFIAGLLHDIGKRTIDDQLLQKREITDKEKAEIAQHASNGVAIASAIIPENQRALSFILLHNKCKGSDRVLETDGEGAPLGAYLLRVPDKFDALVTPRPYRDGFITPEEAIAEIKKEKLPPFLLGAFDSVFADLEFMSRVYAGTGVGEHFLASGRRSLIRKKIR